MRAGLSLLSDYAGVSLYGNNTKAARPFFVGGIFEL
jgi:hypothetical protein